MQERDVAALDALATAEDLQSRSGLEFMHDILAGHLAGAPIWQSLNFRLEAVEPGRVSFIGQPDIGATNMMRGVHGGWFGAILDSCMACAVMTHVPRGRIYTTLEYKINITRALPVGTRVRAVGIVLHAGRSTGVATGEVRGIDDNRLYATGATTCMIMSAVPG